MNVNADLIEKTAGSKPQSNLGRFENYGFGRFTCSKSTIETLEKGVNYVQS